MLDKIRSLYIQGKLGPNFDKVADLIVEAELNKSADITQEVMDLLSQKAVAGDQNSSQVLFGAMKNQQMSEMAGQSYANALKSAPEALKLTESQIEALAADAVKGGDAVRSIERMLSEADKKRFAGAVASKLEAQKAESLFASAVKRVGSGLPAAATIAGIAGLSYLNSSAKHTISDQTFTTIFNNIIQKHPELDLAKAKKNFDSLRSIAPHVAENEEAAYGFLMQAQEWPYIYLDAVQKLTQAEKNINDSGGESMFSRSLSELGKGLGNLIAFGE